ncbi:hypothetical protein [Massilia sp. CCM 8734]|uniref:hypothetical protein n=1 Tax=Massilia sp. CCM 8734 TaxID=2609283 RepID=UPI001423E252|nr:hypothetical protein [Massilia sp. CCM 8734]NHZ95174.1 hypothetical protein [Massilia sp. CCM 8734]
MGEILRHAEVYRNTVDKIGSLRPDEEYIYVELGNFLTDVSQFRDPFAHMLAKRTIWGKATRSNWFLSVLSSIPIISILTDVILDIADVDEWLNQLMGEHEPPDKRYGKLAAYFENVILGISHVIFADDIPKRETVRSMLPAQFQDTPLIPAAEVDRVFRRFFTQYYPHEHCDYPPYVMHGEQRVFNRMYRRGPRGVIGFVEEYLRFLSEDLSKLELAWKEKRSASKTSPERHDLLVSFGKLLHVVEDYFFHSNYTELHLWNAERRKYSSAEAEDVFKARFAREALRSYQHYPGYTGYDSAAIGADPEAGGHTRWRRRLMRRLRYPLYVPPNRLSDAGSLPSLDLTYPGGFENKDMFHTMAGALENLEALLAGFDRLAKEVPPPLRAALGVPGSGPLRDSDLVLVRTLLNKDERTRMDDDNDYLQGQLVRHIEQINSGVYENNIALFQAAGFLNQQAADAFRRAFSIDKGVEAMHSRTPGCGGFLIQFLAEAQGELNDSRRHSARLDAEHMGKPNEGNVFDERTDNGASSESIGTHTLLAKDTPKSQPLHEDAEVLGKYASLSVVQLMLKEINDNPDTGTGLDWDRILQHLIRFPHARPGMWETQALAFFRQNANNPGFSDVQDRPEYPRISVADPDGRLLARRNGTRRTELEQMYVKLEEKADRFMRLNIIPG